MDQGPEPDDLLKRHSGRADDLSYFLETGRFMGRCGCCLSGSHEEMAFRYRLATDAVNALPEEPFQVLAMQALYGCSAEQIRERLGLPPESVRRRARSAAAELTRAIDRDRDEQ